jgi:hypothetical protein
MAAADVMAGKSTSGVIEAPSFGLPMVDIGLRQDGRQRAENTINALHTRTWYARAVVFTANQGKKRSIPSSKLRSHSSKIYATRVLFLMVV